MVISRKPRNTVCIERKSKKNLLSIFSWVVLFQRQHLLILKMTHCMSVWFCVGVNVPLTVLTTSLTLTVVKMAWTEQTPKCGTENLKTTVKLQDRNLNAALLYLWGYKKGKWRQFVSFVKRKCALCSEINFALHVFRKDHAKCTGRWRKDLQEERGQKGQRRLIIRLKGRNVKRWLMYFRSGLLQGTWNKGFTFCQAFGDP